MHCCIARDASPGPSRARPGRPAGAAPAAAEAEGEAQA